nr:hypothetical protein GCM10025732_51630 [Glycomyces mayteni]
MTPTPRALVEFVWEDASRFAVRMDDDVSILAVTRVYGSGPGAELFNRLYEGCLQPFGSV